MKLYLVVVSKVKINEESGLGKQYSTQTKAANEPKNVVQEHINIAI